MWFILPLAAPLGRGGHKASIAGSSTGGHPQTPGAGRSLRGCSAKGGDCSHECIATYVLMHGSEVAGGFACVVGCWCGAVDSRKHLARPRTSASGGRQGAWWHDAATQADARVQAGADVPAESANDALEGCACGTASNFDRADGSGCGASGGSMEAAAARRTAAATGWESRWSRPRDRLAATKTEAETGT